MSNAQDGPNLERLYSINLDGSRNHLHPADVRGRFTRWRRATFILLLGIYLALPLVQVGGHPAVHLDIAARRFYLFGAVFNSQDTWMTLFVFAGVAFGLLFFTAWFGRVWCGWACPQTVFLEAIYRPIERLFEGPREKRIRLERAPWTLDKIARRAGKHLVYILLSLFIAHVTLSFFVSGHSLVQMMRHSPREHLSAFLWMAAIAGGFYFNFAWFREQLCIVICPYGRLQSALTDKDSLIIGYDTKRGEPRGKVGSPGKGDCVDCNRCVAVCPTGIDIRAGLQMECIACTRCIDACDEIMDRVHRPRGLIRYDSQNGLEGARKRTVRPRLFAYGALLATALVGLGVSAGTRQPFEANLIRMRGAPYVLDGETIRNSYELHVVNKNNVETRFHIAVQTPLRSQLVVPQNELQLGPLESARVPIFVTVERADFKLPFEVVVDVQETPGELHRQARARFLGPIGN